MPKPSNESAKEPAFDKLFNLTAEVISNLQENLAYFKEGTPEATRPQRYSAKSKILPPLALALTALSVFGGAKLSYAAGPRDVELGSPANKQSGLVVDGPTYPDPVTTIVQKATIIDGFQNIEARVLKFEVIEGETYATLNRLLTDKQNKQIHDKVIVVEEEIVVNGIKQKTERHYMVYDPETVKYQYKNRKVVSVTRVRVKLRQRDLEETSGFGR